MVLPSIASRDEGWGLLEPERAMKKSPITDPNPGPRRARKYFITSLAAHTYTGMMNWALTVALRRRIVSVDGFAP
ncbi:MAG TPA: hypothetical protein EYP33_00010 [Pyrodictium sp.]|nr:hypothetical protein [Pyrodictium sp.]